MGGLGSSVFVELDLAVNLHQGPEESGAIFSFHMLTIVHGGISSLLIFITVLCCLLVDGMMTLWWLLIHFEFSLKLAHFCAMLVLLYEKWCLCVSFFFSFETESPNVAQAGLELIILLPLPARYWDYSQTSVTMPSVDSLITVPVRGLGLRWRGKEKWVFPTVDFAIPNMLRGFMFLSEPLGCFSALCSASHPVVT